MKSKMSQSAMKNGMSSGVRSGRVKKTSPFHSKTDKGLGGSNVWLSAYVKRKFGTEVSNTVPPSKSRSLKRSIDSDVESEHEGMDFRDDEDDDFSEEFIPIRMLKPKQEVEPMELHNLSIVKSLTNDLVVHNILRFMQFCDLVHLRRVCKLWNRCSATTFRSSKFTVFTKDAMLRSFIKDMRASTALFPCRKFKFNSRVSPKLQMKLFKEFDRQIEAVHLHFPEKMPMTFCNTITNLESLTELRLTLPEEFTCKPDVFSRACVTFNMLTTLGFVGYKLNPEFVNDIINISPMIETLELEYQKIDPEAVEKFMKCITASSNLKKNLHTLKFMIRKDSGHFVTSDTPLQLLADSQFLLKSLSLSGVTILTAAPQLLFEKLLTDTLHSVSLPFMLNVMNGHRPILRKWENTKMWGNVTHLECNYTFYDGDDIQILQSMFPNVIDLSLGCETSHCVDALWKWWPNLVRLKLVMRVNSLEEMLLANREHNLENKEDLTHLIIENSVPVGDATARRITLLPKLSTLAIRRESFSESLRDQLQKLPTLTKVQLNRDYDTPRDDDDSDED